jgi:hypothetical protein
MDLTPASLPAHDDSFHHHWHALQNCRILRARAGKWFMGPLTMWEQSEIFWKYQADNNEN